MACFLDIIYCTRYLTIGFGGLKNSSGKEVPEHSDEVGFKHFRFHSNHFDLPSETSQFAKPCVYPVFNKITNLLRYVLLNHSKPHHISTTLKCSSSSTGELPPVPRKLLRLELQIMSLLSHLGMFGRKMMWR